MAATAKMEQMADGCPEKGEKFMEQLYQDISEEEFRTTMKTLMKMDQNIGGMVL